MASAFDYPDHHSSNLKNLDSRWKVAGFFIAMLSIAFLKSSIIAMLGLFLALSLLIFTRTDLSWSMSRILWILFGVLVFIIPTPFLIPGKPLAQWGVLTISYEGVETASAIFFRCLAVSTLALAMIGSATLYDLIRGARGLGLSGKISSIFWLSIRHLDLLSHEFKRMRVALRARGFKMNSGLGSYKQLAKLSANLLVRALDRSERVGLAIRARGFQGNFTSLYQAKTTWRDTCFFLAMLSFATLLLGLDFWITQ